MRTLSLASRAMSGWGGWRGGWRGTSRVWTLLAAAALLLSSSAGAQDAVPPPGVVTTARAQEFVPAPLPPGPALSLDQAVIGSLEGDAAVLAALAAVEGREAALLEARGLFDRSYRLDAKLNYTTEELFGGRLRGEKDRRLRLEIPPPILDQTAQDLIDRIPSLGSLLFSDCTTAQNFFSIEQEDGSTVILCFDQNDNFVGFLGSGIDPARLDAVNLARVFEDLQGINDRLDEFIQVFLDIAADEFRTIAFVLRRTADSLRLQRIRIGELPTDREAIALDMGFDYRFPFRNGARIVSTIGLTSTEENFRGKKLSPAFGDSFQPNLFTTTAGVALDMPLGRGGGRSSAQAAELAAEAGLEAARGILAQTASDRALATVEAYWDLATANRRLELLAISTSAQDRIVSASEELVKGDVIAAIDLKRTSARREQVISDYTGARQGLIAARFALQRTMGRSAGALVEAPIASEPLLEWSAEQSGALLAESPDALVTRALERRSDVRANDALVKANQIFEDAARHDLRPDLNLALNLSYNAIHESFRDRFYDFEGFQRAVQGKAAGPSYGLALRFRVPFRNNEALGRLAQAESDVSRAEIEAAELKKDIRRRIVELQGSTRHAAAQVAALRETLGYLEETQNGADERFSAGDLTLIDVLTTEEQVTATRLQLLDAERRYASLLARLRFETGTLIEFPETEPYAPRAARLAPIGQPVL